MLHFNQLEENVYNAEVFKILVDYEISRSRRYPAPLALLEIEATPISPESVSETFAVAVFLRTLTKNLRSADIPSRTGSRSFRALLPTTDENGARAVCERLLSVFKNKIQTPEENSALFMLHIGASAHPGGTSLSGEALFEKAAEALHQAKSKGAHAYVILT